MRITRLRLYMATLAIVSAGTLFQVYAKNKPRDNETSILARDSAAEDGRGSVELLSHAYHLDKHYMSMTGPRGNHPDVKLDDQAAADETLWITGIDSRAVDAITLAPESNEFICHANLTLNAESTDPDRHNASFDPPLHSGWRVLTLVPGRYSMKFPEGYGIPIKAGTGLDYFTMALNQNAVTGRYIRVRTTIDYRRHVEDQPDPKPLLLVGLTLYQQHLPTEKKATADLLIGHNLQSHPGEQCDQNCKTDLKGEDPSRFVALPSPSASHATTGHPGETCCVMNATADGVLDQFGKENTIHWLVPPGRHQYRTDVTAQMKKRLPFASTAHYITGHLHPYGERLYLVETKSGKVVFDIKASHLGDRLGVKEMSEIVSTEGISLDPEVKYELVCDYNNTTDQPIDAMGIMYVFALDREPAKVASAK